MAKEKISRYYIDKVEKGKSCANQLFREHSINFHTLMRRGIKGYPDFQLVLITFSKEEEASLDECFEKLHQKFPEEVLKGDLSIEKILRENLVVLN